MSGIIDTIKDYGANIAYWAMFILICIVLLFGAAAQPVSAVEEIKPPCIVEKQGDIIYIGETCDVSKVLSWKNQFAWWSSGVPEGTPDKTVSVEGFMYRHYIDPEKYVKGDWFKWEGTPEPSGNMLAFRVREGTRPNVTVTNTTANATKNVTAPSSSPYNTETAIVIARGENLDYNYNTGKYQGAGRMWLFEGSTQFLGMPMEYDNSGYHYTFTSPVTQSFSPDTYTGYIQLAGYNNKQDVFYGSDNTLQSIYVGVKPVRLNELSKVQYEAQFVKMVTNKEFSDDIIIPVNITLKDPEIRITEYYEIFDNLIVEGTTTLSLGTNITCIVDPEHWTTKTELRENTYPVEVTGEVDADRKFFVKMPLKWDELSIGEHLIQLTGDNGAVKIVQNKEFWTSDVLAQTTQRPQTVKVIYDEYGVHSITPPPTPRPTVCPDTTVTTEPPTPVPTVEPIVENATLNATTPQPTVRPRPTTTMITLPLNPAVGCIAIGITFMLWRKR